jgi:hypothetical protein
MACFGSSTWIRQDYSLVKTAAPAKVEGQPVCEAWLIMREG